ncbi:MAG: HPr family phosphocarrier protein [Clostridiales bacterium]|nr:HPr family phosphocarrier protein [Clostridiales bacterium]
MYSIEKQICLNRLVDVQDFVILASKYQCDVKVKSKNSVTDGKSILGILSLALWNPVTVSACGSDAKQFAARLAKFRSH